MGDNISYYKKIDGENIYLASVNVNDAEYYAELKNQEDKESKITFESYLNHEIYDKDKAYAELNDYALKNTFAIINKSDDKFIGLIGLSNTLQINQRSDIWIKMFPNQCQEDRIFKGAEALTEALYYYYSVMNLHSIIIKIPTFDQTLMNIVNYCGKMQYFSTRKESKLYSDGKFYDVLSFQGTPFIYKRFFDCYYQEAIGRFIDIKNINEDKMSKIITGEKVTLQKYDGREDYVPLMAQFLNDPDVSSKIGEYKTNWNDYRAKKQLANVDYLITKNDELLGYINLFRKNNIDKTADLEILIGNFKNQRKGYGSEALDLFLTEQYKNGPYNNILNCVFGFNEASLNFHKKFGYNPIGVREEAYFINGQLTDMHLFEMTKDSYQKVKKK